MLVVIAIAAHQLVMYYKIVVIGSYMSVAPIHLQIIVGLVWPIMVIIIGYVLIKGIVKLDPSKL